MHMLYANFHTNTISIVKQFSGILRLPELIMEESPDRLENERLNLRSWVGVWKLLHLRGVLENEPTSIRC